MMNVGLRNHFSAIFQMLGKEAMYSLSITPACLHLQVLVTFSQRHGMKQESVLYPGFSSGP
jgi:hypothetical protein